MPRKETKKQELRQETVAGCYQRHQTLTISPQNQHQVTLDNTWTGAPDTTGKGARELNLSKIFFFFTHMCSLGKERVEDKVGIFASYW